MKKIVALTGAGISAESGIKTFRDADGLWEGYDLMEVATPQGFIKNPDLVLEFYNQRRRQLKEVKPNQAHFDLKQLEQKFEVVVITQNVDDLHERAESSHIIHLHGELKKVRSLGPPYKVYEWSEDLTTSHKCENGHQMRPHIVWFGETVPEIDRAAAEIAEADIIIVIGTSMHVYPAAGLVAFAPPEAPIYYIDPYPNISYELKQRRTLVTLPMKATDGMTELLKIISH